MSKCKNPKCYAGQVEVFQGRTETEKAGFRVMTCPECKGKWNEPLTIPQQLDLFVSLSSDSYDDELPF